MSRDDNTIVSREVVQGGDLYARVRHRNRAANTVLSIEGVLQGLDGLRRLPDGTYWLHISGPLDERAERGWETLTVVAWTKRRAGLVKAFIQRHPFASVYAAAVLTYNIQEWIK